MSAPVLTFTEKGIYCPAADLYIDPWSAVDRAVVTHGHADHARPGMGRYLASDAAAPVLRHRLGDIRLDTMAYGETRRIGDAAISLHPAGHVPGSAQVRIEVAGEVWVVSGDYKLEADGISAPFEPVACHAFVTECTFGLPVFRWPDPGSVMDGINAWWAENAARGRFTMLGAYSLGKAQRVLAGLDGSIGPILTHGAVEAVNGLLRGQGISLPETTLVTPDLDLKALKGAFVLAPPAALGSDWAGRFKPLSTGFASGWMALRGIRRRRSVDRGFVMSDHADWPGLNAAIRATGAERIFVTHGYTDVFRRWLESEGFDAHVVSTDFGEDDEMSPR